MRKLTTLALLALSLLTVACTETEDADFEAASIDELEGLAVDGETGSFSERAPTNTQPTPDRVNDGSERPAHAPSGEPLTDRIGATGLETAPGQPGSGTAECVTELKLSNGEPVIGVATETAGSIARARYEAAARVKAKR